MAPTILHATRHHHIDDVAIGPEFTAIAASSLVGDTWDGRIILLPHIATDGPTATEVPTAVGNAAVTWLAADTLAVGDDRGDVTIWQTRALLEPTGRTDGPPAAFLTFAEHSQPVTAVVGASGVSGRLASVSMDGTAKVWAATVAGECTATLEHLPQHSWCDVNVHAAVWLDAGAQSLATGASDGVARVWDLRASGPAALRFAAHSAPLLSVAAGAAESQLLAGSECGSLLLFDTRKLDAPVVVARTPGGAVSTLAASAHLACGSESGTVSLMDPRDLKVLQTRSVHADRVSCVSWLTPPSSTSSGVLLSGSWDKRLMRLDFEPAAL